MKAKTITTPDGKPMKPTVPVGKTISREYIEGNNYSHWNAIVNGLADTGLFTREEAEVVVHDAIEGVLKILPENSTNINFANFSADRTKDFFVTFTANGGKEYKVDITDTIKRLNELK